MLFRDPAGGPAAGAMEDVRRPPRPRAARSPGTEGRGQLARPAPLARHRSPGTEGLDGARAVTRAARSPGACPCSVRHSPAGSRRRSARSCLAAARGPRQAAHGRGRPNHCRRPFAERAQCCSLLNSISSQIVFISISPRTLEVEGCEAVNLSPRSSPFLSACQPPLSTSPPGRLSPALLVRPTRSPPASQRRRPSFGPPCPLPARLVAGGRAPGGARRLLVRLGPARPGPPSRRRGPSRAARDRRRAIIHDLHEESSI